MAICLYKFQDNAENIIISLAFIIHIGIKYFKI